MGGPPPPRCLLAYTWAANEGGGSVYGHDAHVLNHEPPAAHGNKQWRRSLCHELFHLWNPKRIGFDSREMWFSEGFTDYYANRILFTTGVLSPAEYVRIVAGWTGDYLGVAGEKGLREGGKRDAKERALIYQGGALAALCIDIELRRGLKNKRTLDEVMVALYEQCAKIGWSSSASETVRMDALP
jgi:predicted metalloprotease with PDZ domain